MRGPDYVVPVRRQLIARAWFGATALVVLVGLVVQLVVAARATDAHFQSVAGRLFNVFCYFTIQSNLIVGVTSLLLALDPNRTSTVFRVFRLDGLVAITVTFVVFHVALADLQDLQGSAKLADFLLHTASPILCVLGWLLFGPRHHSGSRLVTLALIFPLCWLAFTLARGPIVDFYPYPFLDVRDHGYPLVLLNCVIVGLLFVTLAVAFTAADRLLHGRSRVDVSPAAQTAQRNGPP